MKIKICQNKEEWNRTNKDGSFLQSWEWGEFQENAGRKVLRLQAVDNGEAVWHGQGFVHRLSVLGKYVYFSRIDFKKKEMIDDKMINDIYELLIEYFKKNYFAFIRIEPLENLSSVIYHLSFTKNRQPRQTFILDLTQSHEALLSALHSKTRYNIGLAERKGVIIKIEKNVDVFWELNKKTTARDEFKSHGKKYYEKMLEMDICYQLTAYYQDKSFGSTQDRPIAANILTIFNDTATYLHGASDAQYKNLMAPYLLQWEGIKLAKKMNCQYYDFWGVAPKISTGPEADCFHNFCWEKNHPWSGITHFKAGFGGQFQEYPGACDIILKTWRYRLYRLARKIRGLKD